MKRIFGLGVATALALGAASGGIAKSITAKNHILVTSTVLQDGNNWEITIDNLGKHTVPLPGSKPGGYWPKGSGRNYIFGGGFWVGSLNRDSTPPDTQVTWGYNEGQSEFCPTTPDGDETRYLDPLARVYLSTNRLDRHQWPVRDSLGRPVILSMQDSWTKFNDVNPIYLVGGDRPIGVEVTRTGYTWNFQGLADIVIYSFEIKNVTRKLGSPRTLTDVILGNQLDCDIGGESGTSANDLTMLDNAKYQRMLGDSVYRNLAMQYQLAQEPGWSILPPYFVGFRFLEGPTNNTGQTIHITSQPSIGYPEFDHDILPGQPVGMTAFQIFTIDVDPSTAWDRYLELQGYYYKTPTIYNAYEKDTFGPSDKRFVQACGPFNIPVDSTVRFVVAVVGGRDSLGIVRAADWAQNVYDNWRNPVSWVRVASPNGGEIISGTTTVTWTSNGVGSDSVDIHVTTDGGTSWDTIATNRPNNGSYLWNTTTRPDGTQYEIGLFLHNAQVGTWDYSDSTFTVNNPGNGAPNVQLYAPVGGEVWSDTQNVLWYARDPDGDTLDINLGYSSDGGGTWQALASHVPNIGSYSWNTWSFPNGNRYYAAVTASDGQYLIGDTSGGTFTIDNNHPPAGTVSHDSGGTNTVTINPYVVDPPRVTGHRYRIGFLPIGKDTTAGNYTTALYSYDMWDLDLGQRVITSQVTSVPQDDTQIYDNSPVVDGLRVEMRHRVFAPLFEAGTITPSPGYADTVFADTGAIISGVARWVPVYWSARGRFFSVTWHRSGGSTGDSLLSVTVRDSNNHVDVPFEGGRNAPGLRLSSWAFGVDPVDSVGYQYIDSVSCSGAYGYPRAKKARWLHLCGFRYFFNFHTIAGQRRPDKMVWTHRPADGDIWYIQQTGQRPPLEGDVYTFQTQVGVEEARSEGRFAFSLGQAYPNPASRENVIPFSLEKKGRTSLKIYNVTGALVRTLVDSEMEAGRYQEPWDGRNDHRRHVACGIYLYRLEAPGKVAVKKMVVLR